MNRITRFLFNIKLLSLLLFCTPLLCLANSTNGKGTSVEVMLKNMTLEEKVGQMFLIGFKDNSLTKQLKYKIRKIKPGGIIFFSHNIKSPFDASQLVFDLKLYNYKEGNKPLFLSIDQEGGVVTRIKTNPLVPSASALGRLQPSKTREVGEIVGELLNTVGFNMNFAPVLDLGELDDKSFIGSRAFSSDPQKVKEHSLAFIQGLASKKILPTAKHFPGHGQISGDSHKKTPIKNLSYEELEQTELVPYTSLSGFPNPLAIMVAHISFPQLDPTRAPATFSKPIIEGILKKKLSFEGLVITDDIEMSGAKNIGSTYYRVVESINSGVDLVMVAWNNRSQFSAKSALLQAVKTGDISEKRIDESVLKILKYKMELDLFKVQKRSSLAEIKNVLNNSKLRSTVDSIESQVLDDFEMNDSEMRRYFGKQIIIMSAYGSFYNSFKKGVRTKQLKFLRVSRKTSLQSLKNQLLQRPNSLIVYYLSGANTFKTLEKLKDDFGDRLLIVNASSPHYSNGLKQKTRSIGLYFHSPSIGEKIGNKLAQHWISLREQRLPSGKPEKATKNSPKPIKIIFKNQEDSNVVSFR